MSGFKRATKAQTKLRAAFFGPSGAGKTFSALRVATGLAAGDRIAVIDTEGSCRKDRSGNLVMIGSAAKYADRFAFDVKQLIDRSIDGYVAAIEEAAEAGYPVLIIDSMSHAWQTLLEDVEKLAKAKYRGNTWSAWSEGTPLQRKLVQAILGFPGHVITTMRSKTEWTTVDNNGKKVPQRVGLSPEQGKGVEYEFDLLVEISTEHIANVIKDRTGKYQDKLIEKPGEEFGRELADWLSDGAAPVVVTCVPAKPGWLDRVNAAATVEDLSAIRDDADAAESGGSLTHSQRKRLDAAIKKRHDEIEPAEVTA